MDDLLKLFRSNFKNLSGTPDELYKNFDNLFTRLSDNIKNMPELKDYADAYDKYGSDLYKSLKEEVKEQSESYLAKQAKIKKQEVRRERKNKFFELEDGSKVKQYLDDNGNIRAQRRIYQDGTREFRVQHNAETIKKDPRAKNMSKVVSTYDGETTLINKRPNARDVETKTINHKTGEIYKTKQRRQSDWSGGVTATSGDYTSIEEEKLIHDKKMDDKYGANTVEENDYDAENARTEKEIDAAEYDIPDADNSSTSQIDPNNPETPKYEGVDPDKPATWTDDYINDTAETLEELDDMMSRRDVAQNKDIVNQINQQRQAEDVPLNREQRRKAAKEERKKGNTQKQKTKKQKERDERNKKFNDRNKSMGRDPEETKRINREANEQKETKNRERNKHQQQRAEEARVKKERGEKIYKDIVDEWNEKPILEQMNMFNESEEANNFRWKQRAENNLPELGDRKAEIESIPEAMRNPELQNELDEINNKINDVGKFESNIDNGKINQGLDFEHHNMNQDASDYVDWANDLDAKSRAYEFDGSYTAQKEFVDNSGKLIKTKRVTKGLDIGDVSKVGLVTAGLNILGAVGDYKDERRKGRGVVSSAVRAGVKFAAFEAMGLWSIPVMLVSQAPGAVIKGADMLYKENRRMNSAANNQVFGGAQFMDTQQLATMRQSGMEMAKMSQYNLQQTLMGNEATYLHR
jgi:hypothetical protein